MKKKEAKKILNIDELTPREIVKELDKYIIGQEKAKRSVAIAIRNRVRRRLVSPDFQEEIYPKNIIMIGPTGCGKTEIARRISRLAGAPFVKVEATKYTEVGYVGRDVESMIRDLFSEGMNLVQKEFREKLRSRAAENTHERILDLLLPSSNTSSQKNQKDLSKFGEKVQEGIKNEAPNKRSQQARSILSKKLEDKELEESIIEIEKNAPSTPMIQVMSGRHPNFEDMDMQVQNMLGDLFPKKKKKRRVKVKDARGILLEEELDLLIDMDKVHEEATKRTQEMGIVFIDEIDKISTRSAGSSATDVSREGVQRDLLPIVEGCTVNTRHGSIKTDHILFIAAGAFHSSSPADLIPELQGRFPIRVELNKLTEKNFCQILVGPYNSLVRQATELLQTEGVSLDFKEEGIQEIAHFAFEVNESTENIGARRLHTLMETLLDDVSFEAPDLPENKKKIVIDRKFVLYFLEKIVEDKDLSRYIL